MATSAQALNCILSAQIYRDIIKVNMCDLVIFNTQDPEYCYYKNINLIDLRHTSNQC